MGRTVRMVPKDWQHPRDEKGKYIPLLGYDYEKCLAEWNEGAKKWAEGMREDYTNCGWKPLDGTEGAASYAEWAGEMPVPDDYIPHWLPGVATHFQMYETCSEGTPISPVMETLEALARWLADNGASAFGDMTASYESWLEVCRGEWVPNVGNLVFMKKGE